MSRHIISRIAAALFLASSSLPAPAQVHEGKTLVNARLIADVGAAPAGEEFMAGLLLEMAPGWHTYWKDPGDSGLATSIQWDLPPGFEAGEIIWPDPIQIVEPGDIKVNAHLGEVLLMVPIRIAPGTAPGTRELKARADWLVCETICIPGGADLSLRIEIGPRVASPDAGTFGRYRAMVPAAPPGLPASAAATVEAAPAGAAPLWRFLLLGLAGGFLLNLMPCVLPVIALKIVGFIKQAGETPGRIFSLGLAFAGGIFAWFLSLAGLVIGFRVAGSELNWAFQFQNPWFLLGMSAVVLLFALNLFGVFEVFLPSRAGSKLADLSGREGLLGAFLHGAFATLLATPCTGPFFGTALGFAVSQPIPSTLAVFASMALGMSFPYIILCARPGWMRFLPKPGVWMERLKQFMGFLLLATVLWLLWVIGRQRGTDAAGWASAVLLLLGVAGWIKGAFASPTQPRLGRVAAWIAIAACLAAGTFVAKSRFARAEPDSPPGRAQEKPFPEILDDALGKGRTVFVDFTADWCLNCKVNERLVLRSPEVRAAFEENGVEFLVADWTRGDPEITALLKSFGRAGVPLYVVYPDGDRSRAKILPELLTIPMVLEAVGK